MGIWQDEAAHSGVILATIMLLGLLVGMQHALEVDHVAAVASLATRGHSYRRAARIGAIWGMGHSLTLLLFGGMVLFLDRVVPDRLALMLEMGVGIMLIVLGADVLRRVLRDRIHFHSHRHGNRQHFHGHSHMPDSCDAADRHQHEHPAGFPFRSLLVGMMHGMAGSAALIILALKTVSSPLQGIAYILLFGIGSILGMVLLAAAISVPLRYSAKGLTWTHNGIKSLIGMITIGLGGVLVYRIGF